MSDQPQTSSNPSDDWIVLTDKAREKAAEYLKADKQGCDSVRIKFDENGKAGLILDQKNAADDKVITQGGVTVVVAQAAADYVKGVKVDFDAGQGAFSLVGTYPGQDAAIGKKAYEASRPKTAAPAHDAHAAPAAHDAHGNVDHTATYMRIFFALIVLTAAELLGAYIGAKAELNKVAIILFLVILAFVKAALVGLYFMHLKFETAVWPGLELGGKKLLWKHVILVPPVILAIVLMGLLMPDVGGTGMYGVDFGERTVINQTPAGGADVIPVGEGGKSGGEHK